MHGRTDVREDRPATHKRRSQTLKHQVLELRTLELRIAGGEHLEDVLEECAQRLSAMELADTGSES